jgi:hypothetical protein
MIISSGKMHAGSKMIVPYRIVSLIVISIEDVFMSCIRGIMKIQRKNGYDS